LSTGFQSESDIQLEIHWNPIGKWKPSIFQFRICLSVPAGTLFYVTKDSFQLETGNPLESSCKLEIRWNPFANWNPIGIQLDSNWKMDWKVLFPIGNWICTALLRRYQYMLMLIMHAHMQACMHCQQCATW